MHWKQIQQVRKDAQKSCDLNVTPASAFQSIGDATAATADKNTCCVWTDEETTTILELVHVFVVFPRSVVLIFSLVFFHFVYLVALFMLRFCCGGIMTLD